MKGLKLMPYAPEMKQPVVMICTAVLKEIDYAMQFYRGAALVILGVDEQHDSELQDGNLTIGGHMPALNVPSYLEEVKVMARKIADDMILLDGQRAAKASGSSTVTGLATVYLTKLQCPKENIASEVRSVLATAGMNLINTLVVDYIHEWNKRNGDTIVIRLNTHAIAGDDSVVAHDLH